MFEEVLSLRAGICEQLVDLIEILWEVSGPVMACDMSQRAVEAAVATWRMSSCSSFRSACSAANLRPGRRLLSQRCSSGCRGCPALEHAHGPSHSAIAFRPYWRE